MDNRPIVIENMWALERDLSVQVPRTLTRPYTYAGVEGVSLLAAVPFIYDPRQGRVVHIGERIKEELRSVYRQKNITLQRGHYHVGLDGDQNIVSIIHTVADKSNMCYQTLEETRLAYNKEKGKS